ncbi:MAG: hypothetical protein HJJLKODD_01364 [Phycisphaerae bacterium]|nr:hypothetical protein [Phycisphaerae bacterium]
MLNETIENIQEFRGQGRARYLTRQWDVQSLSPDFASAVWTDYDGDTPYADYTVDESGVVTVTKIYEPGLGEVDEMTGAITYFHTDHLGTTRLVTDGLGQPQGQAIYTAFGEKVEESLGIRYGYVGEYGYEEYSDLGMNAGYISERLVHVGYRTYDPSLGRFLERDPIGIRGGLNVYEYVASNPQKWVDPAGLDRWYRYWNRWHRYVTCGSATMGYWDVNFGVPWGWWWVTSPIYAPGATTILPSTRPPGPPDRQTSDEADKDMMIDAMNRYDYSGFCYNCWHASGDDMRHPDPPMNPTNPKYRDTLDPVDWYHTEP